MIRVRTQDTAERIGRALGLVPARIFERMDGVPDFFEGDAPFAGLMAGGTFTAVYEEGDGRREQEHEQRDSACALYPHGHRREIPRSGRRRTVVLPQRFCRDRQGYPSVHTILHELGHMLMYAIHRHCPPRDRLVWSREWQEVDWVRSSSGVIPSLSERFTTYEPDNFREQFAEAFADWLHPTAHYPSGGLPADAFYAPDLHKWDLLNERPSNRRLLAFFNELAGWPGDLPPRIMR